MAKKLWQLKNLTDGKALNKPQPLPQDWGPIFGLSGFKDKLHDLSWLGSSYENMGWFELDQYQPEEPTTSTPEELNWQTAKNLLKESDWAMLLDAPIKTQKRKEYEDYRNKLRNIRKQSGFPHNIKWPVKPK